LEKEKKEKRTSQFFFFKSVIIDWEIPDFPSFAKIRAISPPFFSPGLFDFPSNSQIFFLFAKIPAISLLFFCFFFLPGYSISRLFNGFPGR